MKKSATAARVSHRVKTSMRPGGCSTVNCRSGTGFGPEHAHDGLGDPPPLALLPRELLAPFLRQRVEAGAPVAVGGSPFRVDEAARLEALQRRIERPVVHDEDVVGLL